MYNIGEAAELAGLAPSTLRNWLLGYERKGKLYLPVLRDENNADAEVKWGEFIEAVVLKTLRGDHRVELHDLRVLCHTLRHQENVPYPLAMREILLNGRKLVYPLRLAEANVLIDDDGNILTAEAINLFVSRVKWDGDQPISYQLKTSHPRVRVDPQLRFGAPQIDGVSTASVYELHQAGEPVNLIAETWNVPKDTIEAAIAFETDRQGIAAAA
jgi:uncharacterized protein (DUF433 family)